MAILGLLFLGDSLLSVEYVVQYITWIIHLCIKKLKFSLTEKVKEKIIVKVKYTKNIYEKE